MSKHQTDVQFVPRQRFILWGAGMGNVAVASLALSAYYSDYDQCLIHAEDVGPVYLVPCELHPLKALQ